MAKVQVFKIKSGLHTGERCIETGKVKAMITGGYIFEVKLLDCKHSVDRCFVRVDMIDRNHKEYL